MVRQNRIFREKKMLSEYSEVAGSFNTASHCYGTRIQIYGTRRVGRPKLHWEDGVNYAISLGPGTGEQLHLTGTTDGGC